MQEFTNTYTLINTYIYHLVGNALVATKKVVIRNSELIKFGFSPTNPFAVIGSRCT